MPGSTASSPHGWCAALERRDTRHPLAVVRIIRYGSPASPSGAIALTASLSRRSAVLLLVAGSLALGACGRRGGLELPGPTPHPIGGPTPPSPPQAEVTAAADPANPAQRQPPQRPNYDPNRPVGRGQLVPSGTFVLDPLL